MLLGAGSVAGTLVFRRRLARRQERVDVYFGDGFYGLGQPALVVLGQQIVTTHVLEVEADEVLVITILVARLHLLYGHLFTFRTRAVSWHRRD